jgi:ribonuclease HI
MQTDSQAAFTALNSFELHSNLVWDYQQSKVKLAKHSRIQLVWVPGHTGIDGNATADQLATQGSYRISACSWYMCKGCQQSDQRLNKKGTGVLAIHL